MKSACHVSKVLMKQNLYMKGLMTSDPFVGFCGFSFHEQIGNHQPLQEFVALHTIRSLKWNGSLFEQ
jgi:hypothetical protein